MPFVLVGLILVLAIVALLCADFLRSEALAVARCHYAATILVVLAGFRRAFRGSTPRGVKVRTGVET
jgi:hypothetical protein